MMKLNAELYKVIGSRLDQVVQQPLLPDPIVLPKKAEEVEEEGVGMPSRGEIRIINGKSFLVHKVLEYDSL